MLPGVTAAQAVAARAGAPLGGDYAVVSLSDRLKPWAVIERRLRAVAEADLVLAIYNPASRSRRDQVVETARCCSSSGARHPGGGRPGRRPGRRGADGDHPRRARPGSVDMSCLLIIGSSQTGSAAAQRYGRAVLTRP